MKDYLYPSQKLKNWLQTLSSYQAIFEKEGMKADEQNKFVQQNIEILKKINYGTLTLPKKDGGQGFTLSETIVLHEKLARFDGSTALAIGWTLLTVGDIFEQRCWEPTVLDSFAKQIRKGAIVNRAVSESATGSPIRGGKPTTIATRNGTHYLIQGCKNYTSCAYALDFFLVSAWLEDQEKVGFFLIQKATEGLSIKENWHMVGMRGTGSHDLQLNNVQIDEKFLVEIPSSQTDLKINKWLLLIPATYLGIAQAARDEAVDFANRYQPNSIDVTIAHLPNVQSFIGEMDLLLTQARFALYGAAETIASSPPTPTHQQLIHVAKYTVTNHALAIVDKAMRVVGAKSLHLHHPLQRYYRDIRAGLHNPPMDDLTISNLAKKAILEWEEKEYV